MKRGKTSELNVKILFHDISGKVPHRNLYQITTCSPTIIFTIIFLSKIMPYPVRVRNTMTVIIYNTLLKIRVI